MNNSTNADRWSTLLEKKRKIVRIISVSGLALVSSFSILHSPAMAVQRGPVDGFKNCLWADKEYSDGAVRNESGRKYKCVDGIWKDDGSADVATPTTERHEPARPVYTPGVVRETYSSPRLNAW